MIFIVSPGQSIQRAVDAASPGDTILVRPGTYNQRVSVGAGGSRLRIIGAGAGKTILDGTGLPATRSAFSAVQATHVTIAGFTIRNFVDNSGIDLIDSNDSVVRDNEITGNGKYGITLERSHRTLIRGNRIEQQGLSGICIIAGSERTYVVGNKVNQNGEHGILALGMYTLLYQNEAGRNGAHGVELGTSDVWMIENELRKNTRCGVFARLQTEHLFISGNEVVENGDDGLHLSSGSGHIVLANTFSRNGGGSSAHGVSASTGQTLLCANTIEGNAGTNLNGSGSFTRSLVLANEIKGSGGEGLDTAGGEEDRILLNRVEKNADSGLFIASAGHVIDDNVVHDNKGSGILLTEAAAQSTLRSNKLKGNKPFDFEAQPPADECNTFDLNKGQASSPSAICG